MWIVRVALRRPYTFAVLAIVIVILGVLAIARTNINRNLDQGKEIEHAILDGAQQIAVPALVSTLSICIVFVPMFFLTGVARYLFVPLAEAVVFAMLASYLLSRTLVPTMAKYLLGRGAHAAAGPGGPLQRAFALFERGFERLRAAHARALRAALRRRRTFVPGGLVFCLGSLALAPFLGQDFFPAADAGQLALHLRARAGTRIEETARLVDRVEGTIRAAIPPAELGTIIDDVGLPYSGINLSYSGSAPVGASDADILVSLRPGHRATGRSSTTSGRRSRTASPASPSPSSPPTW